MHEEMSNLRHKGLCIYLFLAYKMYKLNNNEVPERSDTRNYPSQNYLKNSKVRNGFSIVLGHSNYNGRIISIVSLFWDTL